MRDRSGVGDAVVGGSVLFSSVAALLLYLYLSLSTPWPSDFLLFSLKAAGTVIVVALYSTVAILAYRVFSRGIRGARGRSGSGDSEPGYGEAGSEELERGKSLSEHGMGEESG